MSDPAAKRWEKSLFVQFEKELDSSSPDEKRRDPQNDIT